MTQLSNVRIAVAALSGRVVLARMGKKDPHVALETVDATSDFLRAIVDYVGVDKEVQFGNGSEQFVVTLRRATETARSEP